MFSSLRNTVEALAGATERPHTPDQNQPTKPRGSLDMLHTPSTLADSALTNLKKSLAASHPAGSDSPPQRIGTPPARGLRLEDRLRASFTVGDASNSTTPGTTPAIQRSDPLQTPSPPPERATKSPPPPPPQIDTPPHAQTSPRASSPSVDASHATVAAAAASLLSTNGSGLARSLVPEGDDPLSPIPPPSPVRSPAPPAAAPAEPPAEPEEADISDGPEKPALVTEPEPTAEVTSTLEESTPLPSTSPTPPEAPAHAPAEDASAESDSAVLELSSEAQITSPPEPLVVEDAKPTDTAPYTEPVQLDDADTAVAVPSPTVAEDEVDVEKLQARLKLVEQRFADVSTSFKRLQAEKRAADALLQELTPLESISDAQGLRDYLSNVAMKLEMSTNEIKRLAAAQRQHDSRIVELRETHQLETASQTKLVDQMRAELADKSSKLAAATSAAASDASSQQTAVAQLTTELEKAKSVAKEEEEKRSKAITLLKTVRTKLVKAEKDKEEVQKELQAEREQKDKLSNEMKGVAGDIERVRSEREREVRNLRDGFDRELANVRERSEREAAARKGQYELEAITTKATHDQAVAAKQAQITTLENNVRSLTVEKSELFDQLQQRQGEIESAQAHLETLESQTGELQYQLREANDRAALLSDELADSSRSAGGPGVMSSGGGMPSEDVARLLREAEGKYEARLGDLRERMRALERERTEAEEEWSRNLAERSREIERLRRLTGEKDGEYEESVRGMREREKRIAELERLNTAVRRETEQARDEVKKQQRALEARAEVEAMLKEESAQLQARLDGLVEQIDDLKTKDSQSRAANKTLRDELRKVQQSAALLERQRNPGVGYWSGKASTSNGGGSGGPESPIARRGSVSTEAAVSPPSSPRPSSPALSNHNRDEEDVNLEYVRNVILQFLEHKEMRPNLVRVLSTILRFTPQETRRLIAKV